MVVETPKKQTNSSRAGVQPRFLQVDAGGGRLCLPVPWLGEGRGPCLASGKCSQKTMEKPWENGGLMGFNGNLMGY